MHTLQHTYSNALSHFPMVEHGCTRMGPGALHSSGFAVLWSVWLTDCHRFLLVQEDEGVWVPEAEDAESPEEQQQVPLERVLRIVESAYGQRQDKEHNPHGEHAHDVWQVCEREPLAVSVLGGRRGELQMPLAVAAARSPSNPAALWAP